MHIRFQITNNWSNATALKYTSCQIRDVILYNNIFYLDIDELVMYMNVNHETSDRTISLYPSEVFGWEY